MLISLGQKKLTLTTNNLFNIRLRKYFKQTVFSCAEGYTVTRSKEVNSAQKEESSLWRILRLAGKCRTIDVKYRSGSS